MSGFGDKEDPILRLYRGYSGTPAHPDSPAGGGGPGNFSEPGPLGLAGTSMSGLPHPDSPAGSRLTPSDINKAFKEEKARNTTPSSIKTGTTARLKKPWAISSSLLFFLATWENGVANGKNFAHQMVTDGFILTVYNDSKQLPTVGCGHLVVAADKLKIGDKITSDRAKELLKSDLSTAERAINSKVNVPLFGYEYDALVSIAFNTGQHGVAKLAESVNGGKYEDIPDQIEKYRTGGGNEYRRKSEANLFKSGVYDASH